MMMKQTFIISAGCSYSWATYTGFNAPGLVQQGAPNTYNQGSCQTACIATPSCNSIDFNSQDLTCWFGTAINPSRVANAPVTHYDLTRSCGANFILRAVSKIIFMLKNNSQYYSHIV
jgi:hypothetical protein